MDEDFNRFKEIDLVIGGSPCQKFSIAQNTARETEKDNGIGWQLFMKFVEAIKTIRPTYFIYENVNSMHRNIRQYITEELGVEPIMINSSLVSAQQRKRLYWTNIPNVTQPADKRVLLKDILEGGLAYQDKNHCISATYSGAVFWNSLERRHRGMVAEPVNSSQLITLADKSQSILSTLYKENPVSMITRNKRGLLVAKAATGAALRTRKDESGSFKRLEVRGDGKTNALTTVQTDSVVCSPIRLGTIGKDGQGERIYNVHGKTVCISANGGGRAAKTRMYKINLPDGDYIVRKLTPLEAERCQTLDDGYTAFGMDDSGNVVRISNTRRYMAIGNGWTCDVVAHILAHLKWGVIDYERI